MVHVQHSLTQPYVTIFCRSDDRRPTRSIRAMRDGGVILQLDVTARSSLKRMSNTVSKRYSVGMLIRNAEITMEQTGKTSLRRQQQKHTTSGRLSEPSALTGAATLLRRTDFAELRAQPLARAGAVRRQLPSVSSGGNYIVSRTSHSPALTHHFFPTLPIHLHQLCKLTSTNTPTTSNHVRIRIQPGWLPAPRSGLRAKLPATAPAGIWRRPRAIRTASVRRTTASVRPTTASVRPRTALVRPTTVRAAAPVRAASSARLWWRAYIRTARPAGSRRF
jgi:hypothetical protein